jgi:hypothetical protein
MLFLIPRISRLNAAVLQVVASANDRSHEKPSSSCPRGFRKLIVGEDLMQMNIEKSQWEMKLWGPRPRCVANINVSIA